MPLGLNEVNYALKRIYPKAPPMNIASWPHAFFTNCPKEDGWTGEENFKQSVEYVNPQGIGGDFVKAKAAAANSSTKGKAFDVPRRWKQGLARIDGKAIVATSSNEGAFFKAVKKETDNGIRSFGSRLSVELLGGDGNGWIGRVQSIAATVVTLGIPAGQQQKWHATRFKEGMSLNRSTDGTLANIQAETYIITAVNYPNGTITLNNVTNLANGNFLAPAGDYEEGGCHGVGTWIPLTEPGTSDSFFGVNRSANVTLLSGHRLPASTASTSVKEQAFDLVAQMTTAGAVDDSLEYDGYLHPYHWNRLQKELDAQVKRDAGANGKFGHPYISQASGGREVKWFQETDMEADRMYILTRSTWKIRHAMGFPHLNEDDGNSALRSDAADAIDVRLRSSGNLFCLAPGANGVAPLVPPA